MKRAPLFLRTAGGLMSLAALMAATPVAQEGPTADVTAVSVLPSPGRAEVVVDVRGMVEVSDFVLRDPARLVVDLVGARLVAPTIRYDGVNRGGIRNIRYAQFRPDVVRVVVELDTARDYQVTQEENAVRVGFEAAQAFDGWSSDAARIAAARAPAPVVTPAPTAFAGALPPAVPPAAGRAPGRAARSAPAAGERAPQQQVSQQPRISVTFDRATIQEVIANFAAFSGRSIITGKDVAGEVTAEIKEQPWDIAFFAILAGQGLAASELPGGIIRVDSRENLAVQDSLEPLTTRIIKINYARAASLAPSVAGVVTPVRGRVVPDTTTNSIIITDLRSRIATVDSFIQSLDVRTPQVAIQAKIVFVDRTDLEDLGIRYDLGSNQAFFNRLIQRADLATDPTGATPFPRDVNVINLGGNGVAAIGNALEVLKDGNPALSLIYSTVLGNFTLTAFLDALQSVALADVQAEPSVTVVDNRQATIFVGERTPVRQIDVAGAGAAAPGAVARATTTFQETGIKLEVTPHVVSGTREVLLELHAERSAVQASEISELGAIFTTQEGTTQLIVGDGETAVIGGLTVTEVTVSKTGIPFLVDLPVLGRLFGFRSSRERRRDLLILVTPHIVDDLSQQGAGGPDRR
ncbi:MAG: AMIN domain-containing protein [Gemmatimonadetes bacterium]|nr:AMIN domain-containing protein [Gemmatimonadota bacterium]